MEYLKPFCSQDNERISTPWTADGYTYATDGVIAVRVPAIDGVPNNNEAPDMQRLLWDHGTISDWRDLPEYDITAARPCKQCKGSGKSRVCYECDGDGELELDSGHNLYDVECATCHGDGVLPAIDDNGKPCARCDGTGKDLVTPVPWGEGAISMKMLQRIGNLPGAKMSQAGGGTQTFRFKFDGGEGLVMPMRS